MSQSDAETDVKVGAPPAAAEAQVTHVDEAPAPRLIVGWRFLEALETAGLIHDVNRMTRLVIVADAGAAIHIYQTHVGDTRLLDIVPELEETDDPRQAIARRSQLP